MILIQAESIHLIDELETGRHTTNGGDLHQRWANSVGAGVNTPASAHEAGIMIARDFIRPRNVGQRGVDAQRVFEVMIGER